MSTFFGIYDLNLVTSGCKDKYDGHKNRDRDRDKDRDKDKNQREMY